MQRADALARLSDMVAADKRPALSAATLDRLLDDARMPDTLGRLPTDPGYVADQWDLNGAAAAGWGLKAAAVAGDYSFTADDLSVSKGDVLAHMLDMQAKMAASASGTTTVAGLRDPRTYDPKDLLP